MRIYAFYNDFRAASRCMRTRCYNNSNVSLKRLHRFACVMYTARSKSRRIHSARESAIRPDKTHCSRARQTACHIYAAHIPLVIVIRPYNLITRHSGGARVLTQSGMRMFLRGAIFILDSGVELAKWATEARSPSIGLIRMKWSGKTLLDII